MFLILMTTLFYNAFLLQGEICCSLLLGFKGLSMLHVVVRQCLHLMPGYSALVRYSLGTNRWPHPFSGRVHTRIQVRCWCRSTRSRSCALVPKYRKVSAGSLCARVFCSLQGNPPGGVLPSNRVMEMCRWMGSHPHGWIDYNGVAFSLEVLEWGRTFSWFGETENSGS